MILLRSLFDFLRDEKRYAFLLFFCIALYIFCFFWFPDVAEQESVALEKFKQVEAIHEEDGAQKILEILSQDGGFALFAGFFNLFFVVLLAMGIGVQAVVLSKILRKREILHPTIPTHIRWNIRDVARFFILAFSFSLVSSIYGSFITLYWKLEVTETAMVLLQATLIDSFILGMVLYYGVWKYQGQFASLGLTTKNFLKDVWLGVLAYSWVLPVFLVIIILLSFLIKTMQYEPPPHTLIDILVVEDKSNVWLTVYSVFLACLFGPLIEEIFFRGFLYSALREKWGVVVAIVFSSLFFAAIHQSIFALVPIFFLGVVLAYLREKKGSLTPAIAMHILHNTILLVYFFIIKRGIMDHLL